MNTSQEKINRCKIIALIGIVIMGIGSFMSCLSATNVGGGIGTTLLVISLIITTYGFTYWRP